MSVLLSGYFMLFEALSQHQLSAKAAGFYMIAVSLILPLLILIFVYQIVNRNRLSLLSKCVGIPGALAEPGVLCVLLAAWGFYFRLA